MPGSSHPDVNLQDIADILNATGLTVGDRLLLPARAPKYRPVPQSLHPQLAGFLHTQYPSGLYAHQALGIEVALAGNDICLATPTASGKSLVFMTLAAQATLADPFAQVLAIYPAKALIQDQLSKWQLFLGSFGVRVGFIDGSVSVAARASILRSCRVVAMTPDVVHAWLMSHLASAEVASFLKHLSVLILDEAHVYDGAFGTNMAYMLRRLAAASKQYRLICSTATIGEPGEVMTRLTGRTLRIVGTEEDGSAVAAKTLLLTTLDSKRGFDQTVQLLANLSKYGKARFLAFGDSRKAVERLVAAVLRPSTETTIDSRDFDDPDDDVEPDDSASTAPAPRLDHVLPYRAGYEADDRQAIQDALSKGTLSGVVSTSALELGLDIGDLDLVVLLNTPPSIKAFLQRIGRAGRRRAAACILIDDQGVMAPLANYVARQPEPSWLYLENRYIQYSNALCAAAEIQAQGRRSSAELAFSGLPETFRRLVENELNPTEAVPPDLYALKQKAQNSPHYEFPIRSAAEQNFSVEGPFGTKLGILSYSQALREAYPGAVYYYMAKPFRVQSLEFKKGLIRARRTKFFSTKPLVDNIAFPNFKNGIISVWRSDVGFVCEAELQVSERVKGFVEQRGQKKTTEEYGAASRYSQKPLTRFFQTTGVCWAFPGEVERSEAVAASVLEAFSITCGVHERDLGVAFFKANEGPFNPVPVSGTVVFDATNGSLRLTERLAESFQTVIEWAAAQAEEPRLRTALMTLHHASAQVQLQMASATPDTVSSEDGWVQLIARGEPAMYMHADGPIEVTTKDFRYTPHGLMYELANLPPPRFELRKDGVVEQAPVKWMVLASHLQPIHGRTRMIRFNLVTGEERLGDRTEVAFASDRARKYVANQLGRDGKWVRALEGVWAIIESRPNHEFRLSDVDAVAEASDCSDDDVLAMLAVLSEPSAGLLRIEFRDATANDQEVSPSEVTRRLRAWWKTGAMSEEEWRAWASRTKVKWVPRAGDTAL